MKISSILKLPATILVFNALTLSTAFADDLDFAKINQVIQTATNAAVAEEATASRFSFVVDPRSAQDLSNIRAKAAIAFKTSAWAKDQPTEFKSTMLLRIKNVAEQAVVSFGAAARLNTPTLALVNYQAGLILEGQRVPGDDASPSEKLGYQGLVKLKEAQNMNNVLEALLMIRESFVMEMPDLAKNLSLRSVHDEANNVVKIVMTYSDKENPIIEGLFLDQLQLNVDTKGASLGLRIRWMSTTQMVEDIKASVREFLTNVQSGTDEIIAELTKEAKNLLAQIKAFVVDGKSL